MGSIDSNKWVTGIDRLSITFLVSLLLLSRIWVFLTALSLPFPLLFILVVYDCLVLSIFCKFFRRKSFRLLAYVTAYLFQLLYSFINFRFRLIDRFILGLFSTIFGKGLIGWVSTWRRNIDLLLIRFGCFWIDRGRELYNRNLRNCAY